MSSSSTLIKLCNVMQNMSYYVMKHRYLMFEFIFFIELDEYRSEMTDSNFTPWNFTIAPYCTSQILNTSIKLEVLVVEMVLVKVLWCDVLWMMSYGPTSTIVATQVRP
jgi:hypothetical protein